MSSNKNYLALDIGASRIGMAVGSIMAFGRGAIDATDPRAINTIKDLVASESIDGIIVGLPEVKSGDHTESYQNAMDWVARLKQEFPDLTITTVNEAYSSRAAEHDLKTAGIDVKINKEKVDERAAELILAQFLNEQTGL